MIQHTLIGCRLEVAEVHDQNAGLLRVLVITDPSGQSWHIPMEVMLAIRIGRALLGQSLVVPQNGGTGSG